MNEIPSVFFEEFASTSQKKRIKILETLLHITVRDGLGDLSLTKISQESKIPKSLVLYHFPDIKEAQLYLFKVVARTGIEITLKNMQGVSTALGQLEVIVKSAFEWAVRHPNYARYFLLMHHLASVDKRFASIHNESVETGSKRIASCVDEIFKKKVPRAEVQQYAIILHSLLSMTLVKMTTANEFDDVKDYIKTIELAYTKILGREFSVNYNFN